MGKSVRIDLAGEKFGRLSVTAYAGTVGGRATWACSCECGGSKNIPGKNLRAGLTKSCGCIKKEMIAKVNFSHGLSDSSTYGIYHTMISRCTLPSQDAYERYGGSGITVCERWMESFENFLADMGERPGELTLDRENPFGNYEPNNCRWADKKTQSLNTRGRKAIQMMNQDSKTDTGEAEQSNIAGTYGYALSYLKAGHKMARLGWNGKNMWIEQQTPDAHSKMTLPYLYLNYPDDAKNTPGARVPWTPSQTDQLAEDWTIVVPALAAAPTMPPHQQRVIDEHSDLADKIAKLKAFFGTTVFGGLPDGERHRMERQLDAMTSYGDILAERIAYF